MRGVGANAPYPTILYPTPKYVSRKDETWSFILLWRGPGGARTRITGKGFYRIREEKDKCQKKEQ